MQSIFFKPEIFFAQDIEIFNVEIMQYNSFFVYHFSKMVDPLIIFLSVIHTNSNLTINQNDFLFVIEVPQLIKENLNISTLNIYF